jgi:3-phosphoshikimate 1-carboxyvinyltransferase
MHSKTYIHSKPSAQVKSGLLLASLYHESFQTTITEETPTRDHTERMLSLMGVNLVRLGNSVTVGTQIEITKY